MLKSITLALGLAATLALPIAANAVPNDGSGSGDGQMNKETCEALGGTFQPANIFIHGSLSFCYYPDGGVTTCTSWACEYTPPRAVMMTPAITAAPPAVMMQR